MDWHSLTFQDFRFLHVEGQSDPVTDAVVDALMLVASHLPRFGIYLVIGLLGGLLLAMLCRRWYLARDQRGPRASTSTRRV